MKDYWLYLSQGSEYFFQQLTLKQHVNSTNKCSISPQAVECLFYKFPFCVQLISQTAAAGLLWWITFSPLLVFFLFLSRRIIEASAASARRWAWRSTLLTNWAGSEAALGPPAVRGNHGRPEVSPAPPAPAAAPDAPRQDVTAVGLPLQPVPGPGRHSQDHCLL